MGNVTEGGCWLGGEHICAIPSSFVTGLWLVASVFAFYIDIFMGNGSTRMQSVGWARAPLLFVWVLGAFCRGEDSPCPMATVVAMASPCAF